MKWELQEIVRLAQEAGRIGLDRYGRSHSELKDDGTVVTEADRGIEAFLARELDAPAEGSYLLGEETIDTRGEAYLGAALNSAACWVVDPVDGTAPFSAEFPSWGVSIGLVRHGELAEGIIYQPALGMLIVSDGDEVYVAEKIDPECDSIELRPASREKRAFSGAGHVGITQHFAKHARLRFPHAVFSWCSCVTPFHYLATGRLLAQFVDAKIWDVAGGFPILRKLGFTLWGMTTDRAVTPRLNEDDFYLAPDAVRRWGQRQGIVAAPDPETARYFAARVEMAEAGEEKR